MDENRVGLILTGGGARAAYQVGVLKAIAEILPGKRSNPFPIICGTSAGALNAAALAVYADNFHYGVQNLADVWAKFELGQVYRSDPWGVFKTAARWLSGLLPGERNQQKIGALLDNSPLRKLLQERLQLGRINEHIQRGCLYALSISATGYTSGESVSFFQGAPEIQGWKRARRIGAPSTITLDHLMASSAIPFIFPAVKIHREFFGDGAMRQIAPLSPAVHLGADRLMVIAVGPLAREETERQMTTTYPSVAQIAGHAMASIFLDSLEIDLERLQRINRTVRVIPPDLREKHQVKLRPIEALVISPSEEFEPIANRYAKNLPRSVALFLGGIGATKQGGSNLLSYLLFDKEFCDALISLGYRDAMTKKAEIRAFIDGDPMAATIMFLRGSTA